MLLVSVMLCVIFGLVIYFTQTNLENESISMMQNIANRPLQLDAPNGPNLPDQNIRLPYFVIYLNPEGEIQTTNGGNYDLSDKDFLNELLDTALSTNKQYGVVKEYNLRFLKNDMHGETSIVFADISSEASTLNLMTKTCSIIGALTLLVFLGISILFSRWAVKPVETAWLQQRQFVADAAHELKTPLTVIMTNSEFANSDEYSEEEKSQFISNIRTVSQHMKSLVEQMLTLARSDNGVALKFESVNLSSIVTKSVLTFVAMLFEQGHQVTYEIAPDISIHGNEEQITELTGILLDNAGKYASSKGKIWVTLRKPNNHKAVLCIANEGSQIPEKELRNLFKRFYRLDSARTRDGSFGLGLSIAESIVAKHKGKIWAESKDGINSFYISLPV